MSSESLAVVILRASDVPIERYAERRRVESPETLFIWPQGGFLARGQGAVRVSAKVARMILASVGRQGEPVSHEEMIEIVFGDRADGGPDGATQALAQYWSEARHALAFLGYAGSSHRYFGFRAWRADARRIPAPIMAEVTPP